MSTARIAAHVHSDWSYDGTLALGELTRAFRRRGYDAVLMAEHDRGFDAGRFERLREACVAASGSGLVLVPGIEYSDPANTVHVPVWGAEEFLGEGLVTDELLDRVKRAGAFALLAHPGRRDALDRLAPGTLGRFDAVELWNRKYDGYAPSRAAAAALERHPSLQPFVGLDFHTARQFHPLAMEAELDGPPDEARLTAALREGRLRATAFGRPADSFAHGVGGQAVRGLELGRRHAARAIRGGARRARAVGGRRARARS